MMLNTSSSAPKSSSRSVDEYYNIAYEQGTNRWHFWLIFLSLGIANSGDATEITCMNYILSHPLFKEEILQSVEPRWKKIMDGEVQRLPHRYLLVC